MARARPQLRPSLRVCLTCLARSLSLLDKAERPCLETEVNDAVARCWDPENVFGELTTDILEEQHVKMGIHGSVFSVEQHPSSALLVSGAWRGVPQWHQILFRMRTMKLLRNFGAVPQALHKE